MALRQQQVASDEALRSSDNALRQHQVTSEETLRASALNASWIRQQLSDSILAVDRQGALKDANANVMFDEQNDANDMFDERALLTAQVQKPNTNKEDVYRQRQLL